MSTNEASSRLTPQTFVDSLLRVGLIVILTVACFRVFSPFVSIMLWALMLAIMLYPLHQRVARRLGGRSGLAATLMIVAVCVIIDPPLVLLSGSFMGEAKEFRKAYEAGEVSVPAPDAAVAEWPVVGERLYGAWSDASADLPGFLGSHATQVKELGHAILTMAGDAIGSVFLFFGAFIIAGIMMALGRQGSGAMERIFCRVAGPEEGPGLLALVVATVRSVATGVLGVAFIQALLFGVGFVLAGVPAAGLLALVVMFIGIIQLPAAAVAIPVVIWVWAAGGGSVAANIFFTIYFVVAGLSDNVLKPLLLGRGVEAPMPVILIGAIGGMIMGGLIGLFLGAVLLAVGYQVFMKWSRQAAGAPAPASAEPDSAAKA